MCVYAKDLHGPPAAKTVDLWADVGENPIGSMREDLDKIAAIVSLLSKDIPKIQTRFNRERKCAEFFRAHGDEVIVIAQLRLLLGSVAATNQLLVATSLNDAEQAKVALELPIEPIFEKLKDQAA